MRLQVRVSARCAAHVRRAADWWLVHRVAAPGAIAQDFGEALALLAEQPGIGARYAGRRSDGLRRLFLGRIGYFIDYKASAEHLDVLAFWHARREHGPQL